MICTYERKVKNCTLFHCTFDYYYWLILNFCLCQVCAMWNPSIDWSVLRRQGLYNVKPTHSNGKFNEWMKFNAILVVNQLPNPFAPVIMLLWRFSATNGDFIPIAPTQEHFTTCRIRFQLCYFSYFRFHSLFIGSFRLFFSQFCFGFLTA